MLQTNGCGHKKQRIQLAILSYWRACSVMINALKRFRNMTDTQASDVVTFDFKGTRVHSFVSGYTEYQMDFYLKQTISK